MTVTAYSDLDKVAARVAVDKSLGSDSGGAGLLLDLWTAATPQGAQETATQRRPDNTTTGCLLPKTLLRDASGSLENYLRAVRHVRGQLQGGNIGQVFWLYDRIYGKGAFVGNITTAQTVDATPTLPVDRGPGFDGLPGNAGDDCEILLVVRSSVGANAATVVATYTNELGTSGRTTPSILLDLNRNPGKGTLLPLASGDRGVRSVQSIQITTATASAGNFEVLIIRRLCPVPNEGVMAGETSEYDWMSLGLPLLYPRCCVAMLAIENTAQQATKRHQAQLEVIEA